MRTTHDVFHLAIPVHDLDAAQHFYVSLLGCKLARRYPDRITVDFFGDQLVCHLTEEMTAKRPASLYPRHFGVTFRAEADFEALHACAVLRKIPFYQEVSTRFEGMVEEHHTFVLLAFHLSDVHDWVVRNAPLVVFLTVASAIFAEGVYFLGQAGVTRALGSGSDPFQPSVIPFNVCVLGCGYLAGMFLVRPWRSRRIRAAVRIGSDNAYGIYLAQMIFITSLGALGWRGFADRAPFWVWLPLTLAIAYLGSIALTAVLARTPLAVPLTGRKQQPWRTLLPRRVPVPAAAAPADAGAAGPVTPPEPAALAGTTTDQSGS